MIEAVEVAPVAQQSSPVGVQATELNEVGVVPVLLVQAVHVTVVPVMWLIAVISAVVPTVPMAMQNVVLLQAIWVSALHVADELKAVQVVPGDAEPVLEMIVATLDEVVPKTKQIGCAVALGHTIWVKAVTVGVVSLVQVTVDPEMVALSKTPFEEVPDPMATQAGVVAPFGHTMLVNCDTPAGRVLFVHVVPLVDTAAAPPDEL
jgi:hypothetical protein